MWSPVRTAIFQPRSQRVRERRPGYTSPKYLLLFSARRGRRAEKRRPIRSRQPIHTTIFYSHEGWPQSRHPIKTVAGILRADAFLERLKPCKWKLSRTVLRGVGRLTARAYPVAFMELHIDIRLSGVGFATEPEREQIEKLITDLQARGIGQLVDTGTGRGHADVYLRINSSAQKQAVTAVREILDGNAFAGRSVIRILPKRQQAETVRLPEQGAAFVFPVLGTKYGCCRVIRTPTKQEEIFFGETKILVATSSWIGDRVPLPSLVALRDVLVLTHHFHKGQRDIFWTGDPQPAGYVHIGQIEPSTEDIAAVSQYHGGWSSPVQLEAQYDWDRQEKA